MSEYLDRSPRTEEEALEDIRRDKIKLLNALVNRAIKLLKESNVAKQKD